MSNNSLLERRIDNSRRNGESETIVPRLFATEMADIQGFELFYK